jgi:transcriptional regulator with XRE-family HTH domain
VTVAERIRHFRSLAKLSQRALAIRLGVDPSAVALWEGDYNQPRSSRLDDIAQACGVSLETFFQATRPRKVG